MGITSICFGTSCNCASQYEVSRFAEMKYQNVFKKLISFLYNHPNLTFTMTFYGPWLQWVEKKHPEFLTLLSQLIGRKQIEIEGGGYYNPIFPFLLPIDRVGQTEYLTTTLRKIFGKRPRGIYLENGIWDSSCISGFKSCGIEYALLDSKTIPQKIFHSYDSVPLIVEEQGKSITVIPVTVIGKFSSDTPETVYETCSYIAKSKQKVQSPFLYFQFEDDIISELLDNGWFERVLECIQNNESAEFSTPSKCLKTSQEFRQKAFIPSGISLYTAQWSGELFKTDTGVIETKQSTRRSVRDFLLTYPEILNLYSRMMYTCLLVNQCRGDKIRKKAAREKLWEAQCGSVYLFTGTDGCADRIARQKAYSCLLQAEKLVRETNGFSPSVISYDFNADAFKEYICQFQLYNAFISQKEGTVFELDLMQNSWNYSDASERILYCDKINDGNRKKMFVDFLMSSQDFSQYKQSMCATKSIFSTTGYTEQLFDRFKHEIILKSDGVYGFYKQNVSLKKKYMLSQDGIKIQYILKNESSMNIKAVFAVESNLSLEGSDLSSHNIEILSDLKHDTYSANTEIRQDEAVSVVKITDSQSSISFLFETNEDAGLCTMPLSVERKLNNQPEKIKEGITNTLFWHIDLSPGLETEKTLNVRIILEKKTSLKPNKK